MAPSVFHDNQRVVSSDKYFVCGGNPDNSGGGVIASNNDLRQAHLIQSEAIKRGYTHVVVLTWTELVDGR